MANLVSVTREGRLFLKIGGLIFAVLMILYIFIVGGGFIRDVFFPKPPPPPAQAFGKLPNINFPASQNQNITFTVNTVDGLLPKLPGRVNVYKLKSRSPDLLALDEAKNRLDSANFVENQVKLSDTVYRWTQSRSGIVIEYDIVSRNFTIFSNYLTNPSLISTGLLPSENSIKSDVKGFLRTIEANTDNLDLDNMKIEYLELQNGQLVEAQNLGSAKIVRIKIDHISVENIELVYGNPEESLVSFLLSYPGSRYQILEGLFYNHEINLDEASDYYIKSVDQAFEDLKQGSFSYIKNPQNLSNVNITKVELKYYLDKESSDYLLPVFVFGGVNFTAFVEAIPQQTEPNTTEPQAEEQIPPSQ